MYFVGCIFDKNNSFNNEVYKIVLYSLLNVKYIYIFFFIYIVKVFCFFF